MFLGTEQADTTHTKLIGKNSNEPQATLTNDNLKDDVFLIS